MKDRRADLIGTVRQKFQMHNGAQSRFQGFRGWVGGEDTETVNAALPSVTTVGTEVEKVWCWYKISTMFWKETEFEKWERLSSLSSRGLFLFLRHFSSLQHWVSVCFGDWKQNGNCHLDSSLDMVFTSIQHDPLKTTNWNAMSNCCFHVQNTVVCKHRVDKWIPCSRWRRVRGLLHSLMSYYFFC